MVSASLVRLIQTLLPMPAEQAAEIAGQFTPLTLPKGSFLVREGTNNDTSYFLETGYCRAFTHDVDNNDITTELFVGGQFANDFVSLFQRTPAEESIQTLCDCQLWTASFMTIQHCFHTLPAFRELGRLMLVRNGAQLKKRMLDMIRLTAEQRYADLLQTHPEVFQYAPLKHIATYLGITDTSLSRIRAKR
jgi:CRP-like cAMP-binding protein